MKLNIEFTKEDWDEIPKVYNWLMIDEYGVIYYFEAKPVIEGSRWRKQSDTEIARSANCMIKNIKISNWRDLLFERPMTISKTSTSFQWESDYADDFKEYGFY